jgi:hypothetical protein
LPKSRENKLSAVVNDAENIVGLGDLSSESGAISGIIRSAPDALKKRDIHHYRKELSAHSSYISSAV